MGFSISPVNYPRVFIDILRVVLEDNIVEKALSSSNKRAVPLNGNLNPEGGESREYYGQDDLSSTMRIAKISYSTSLSEVGRLMGEKVGVARVTWTGFVFRLVNFH